MDRVILHVDANAFYASVECLYRPNLRNLPVAVAGSQEDRHGIILTKNQLAKQAGVKTGEAIWEAMQKCPRLVCLPPNYPLYERFSQKMAHILLQYTNLVEAFGLDESWLDVSGPKVTMQEGERIADEIRNRIRDELGITVSVGVSWNKVFAKLGSDLRKPDFTNVISRDNYKEVAWRLPASDLLYVGPSTRKKLATMRILSIGDLANAHTGLLDRKFGKIGGLLKAYALGADITAVHPADYTSAIKSVGNSSTPPHDICDFQDARCLLFLLAESVGARLREIGLRAGCVTVSARSTNLVTRSKQRVLPQATALTKDIAQMALTLMEERFGKDFPYRSMGVSCSHLVPMDTPVQLDFFGDAEQQIRAERLEASIDGLRKRFGHQIIQRGIVLADPAYARVNPKEKHTIHPVSFFVS